MDVYKLSNDYQFIDLSFKKSEDVRIFSGYKGQTIEEWPRVEFEFSEDKLQKNRS